MLRTGRAGGEQRDTAWLAGLFNILGNNYIPDIEVTDFLAHQREEPADAGDKGLWNREIGVNLALRIIAAVFTEMFEAQLIREMDKGQADPEDLLQTERNTFRQEENLDKEVEQFKATKETSKEDLKKGDRFEEDILSASCLIDLLNQDNILPPDQGFRVPSIHDDQGSSKQMARVAQKSILPRKPSVLKSSVTSAETDPLENKSSLTRRVKQNRKRKNDESVNIFSKRGKPELQELPKSRAEDPSFVPETMPMNVSLDQLDNDVCRSIPDTPERRSTQQPRSPQINIPLRGIQPCRLENIFREPDLHPEPEPLPRPRLEETTDLQPNLSPEPEKRKLLPAAPPSPIFMRKRTKEGNPHIVPDRLKLNNHRSVVLSHKPEKENILQELKSGNGLTEEQDKTTSEHTALPKALVPVTMISPKLQKELDRKTWKQIKTDFSSENLVKKGSASPSIHDEDSDFESPNLLRIKPTKSRVELDLEDHISLFSSPPDTSTKEVSAAKPDKRLSKPKMKKAENRWGIQVDPITASQKKRLKNQKQSKIENYFNQPPKTKEKKLDDLETAIRLSKEEFENQQRKKEKEKERRSTEKEGENRSAEKKKGGKSSGIEEEGESIEIEKKGEKSPSYAFVGPTVRKREERAKLKGFECRECEDYYRGKLEEGYTEDQIKKLLNDCSKHRGRYRPPVTPEKFWDPEIIEGDPNSPRNKTQTGLPLRTRAVRRLQNRQRSRKDVSGTHRQTKPKTDLLKNTDDIHDDFLI